MAERIETLEVSGGNTATVDHVLCREGELSAEDLTRRFGPGWFAVRFPLTGMVLFKRVVLAPQAVQGARAVPGSEQAGGTGSGGG